MNICSEHGDEIAFIGSDCPACEQVEQLEKDHLATVGDLEDQISQLEEQIPQ